MARGRDAEREREAASPPGRQAGRRRRQRRGEESEREREAHEIKTMFATTASRRCLAGLEGAVS